MDREFQAVSDGELDARIFAIGEAARDFIGMYADRSEPELVTALAHAHEVSKCVGKRRRAFATRSPKRRIRKLADLGRRAADEHVGYLWIDLDREVTPEDLADRHYGRARALETLASEILYRREAAGWFRRNVPVIALLLAIPSSVWAVYKLLEVLGYVGSATAAP